MLFNRFSLYVIFFFLTTRIWGQSVGSVNIGKEYKLYSKVLNEERHYFVSLPDSYEGDDFYTQKKYPVMILLDADTHFRSASGIVQSMSVGETEQIPEMIVVAVRNTNRTHDMTPSYSIPEANQNGVNASMVSGGGTNFLRFLETELLPQIDSQYRTLPYRLLVGHSLAGLFAVNCFLDQSLFNAYITIDPTLGFNDGYILRKGKLMLATNTSFKSAVYVAQANNPFEAGKHIGARGKAFDSFTLSLEGNQSKRLRSKYAFYENEDHYSVPLRSLYDGLLFVFEGYKFPLNTLVNQPNADVRNHYKLFFDRLGVDLLPPGKLINQAGLFLLNNQKQIGNALDLLKLNETYYPNSFVTYNSLGDAYKMKGDKDVAIQYYKKSLTLKANNVKASKAIEELTKQ